MMGERQGFCPYSWQQMHRNQQDEIADLKKAQKRERHSTSTVFFSLEKPQHSFNRAIQYTKPNSKTKRKKNSAEEFIKNNKTEPATKFRSGDSLSPESSIIALGGFKFHANRPPIQMNPTLKKKKYSSKPILVGIQSGGQRRGANAKAGASNPSVVPRKDRIFRRTQVPDSREREEESDGEEQRQMGRKDFPARKGNERTRGQKNMARTRTQREVVKRARERKQRKLANLSIERERERERGERKDDGNTGFDVY
ncbi:hypothetical protein EUGRSUZ_D01832 [Eucalyptus grandis]|uniref:Uncharacterized protein n=2 Tax=Eucalyptus grandis TaxID=71139 RepID=A0ACC3L6A7_EUCGR|nr:hypothetical protein EUGRSUZ_D01832 [Eucalyptus grandis]